MDNSVIETYLEHVFSGDNNKITHHGLAKLWMAKYGVNYRCSSLEYNKWYECKGTVWSPIISEKYLPMRIQSTLRHAFAKYLFHLCHSIMDVPNKKLVSKYINLVTKIITKLDGDKFINGILIECAQLSYNKSVEAFNIPMAKL